MRALTGDARASDMQKTPTEKNVTGRCSVRLQHRLRSQLRWLTRRVVFRTGAVRFFWQFRHLIDGSYHELPPHLLSHDPHRMRLCDLIEATAVQSCLEVGCADGANLSVLAARFPSCRLSGLDLNPRALRIARERVRNLGGSVGDMRTGSAAKLPFHDNSYDVVLSDAVFMYLTPQMALSALREMGRVSLQLILVHTFSDDSLLASQVLDGNWVHPLRRLIFASAPHAHVESERSVVRTG